MKTNSINFTFLSLTVLVAWILNLFLGSVSIPVAEVLGALGIGECHNRAWAYIVSGSRLPQAITALLAGAGLGVSGLLLQTSFRNPLAGPSILGISSGASLGVAIVVMAGGGTLGALVPGIGMQTLTVVGALAGSLAIMATLIVLSAVVRNNLMLLIAGILIGYLTSSAVTLLSSLSTANGIQGYVAWGMGTFADVDMKMMSFFAPVCLAGLAGSVLLSKPLNVLLLGNNYAVNLGISAQRIRTLLLLDTGLLTAVITAFCGPVSFIGMAIPHIARFQFKTDDHRILLPGTMLWGSLTALVCCLLSSVPENQVIPINALTPLIGVPVILAVILKRSGS